MAALLWSDAAPADPLGNPAAVKNEDGKYYDIQGNPTYSIKPDGTVDWYIRRAFLLRGTKAAAADHLDAKVRHVWRSIRPPR